MAVRSVERSDPAEPSSSSFYNCDLKPSCYRISTATTSGGLLIASVGRMASGDRGTLLLGHTEERGNLGDGFDFINVLFQHNPDRIPEKTLEDVSTGLQIAPHLRLKAPFVGAGMSVGSIGPGTWRAGCWQAAPLKPRWIPAKEDTRPSLSSMQSGTPWT